MAEDRNIFDLGPAAGPIDSTAFQAAKEAWYTDRNRINEEVLPKIDRAIAEVESWSNVVNNLVALIGTLVPLVQTLATRADTTKATLTEAKNTCEALNVLKNLLQR